MAVSAAQQNEKQKALNLAIAQIEKSYGKGAIMKMGSDGPKVRVDCIPTGAINLDAAIGVGVAPWTRHRDLRTGKFGQTIARPARRGECAEGWWNGRHSSTPSMHWI